MRMKPHHSTVMPPSQAKTGTMPRNQEPPTEHHKLITDYFRAHRKLRPTTKTSTRSTLNRWADFMAERGGDIATATKDDVEAFLDSLVARKLKPNTVNSIIDRLRWFYGWAIEAGVLAKNPTKTKGQIKRKKITNPMAGIEKLEPWEDVQPHIKDNEYAALIKACGKKDAIGYRDAAILSLMRYQGLRRKEVCGLDLDAYTYSEDDAELKVGTAAHRTKNNQQRFVPLCDDTVDKLNAYLNFRDDTPGPLFLSAASEDGRLTEGAINQILAKLRKRAGITRSIGAHEFRRAWTIDFRDRGVRTETLMSVGGWNDPTMVRRYTRAEEVKLAHKEMRQAFAAMEKKARPRLRRVS